MYIELTYIHISVPQLNITAVNPDDKKPESAPGKSEGKSEGKSQENSEAHSEMREWMQQRQGDDAQVVHKTTLGLDLDGRMIQT